MKGNIEDEEWNFPQRVILSVARWEATLKIWDRDGEYTEIVLSADEFFRERDNIYVATRAQYEEDLDAF